MHACMKTTYFQIKRCIYILIFPFHLCFYSSLFSSLYLPPFFTLLIHFIPPPPPPLSLSLSLSLHLYRCTQTSKKPSECGDIFQRTLLLSANSSSLPTDTLLLQPHLAAADVNVSCESVVTAWECYYTHTPCHSARGVCRPQPLCQHSN